MRKNCASKDLFEFDFLPGIVIEFFSEIDLSNFGVVKFINQNKFHVRNTHKSGI